MNKQCIMKPNSDYILTADVCKLTTDQWEQFRDYLRSYGYPIDLRWSQWQLTSTKVSA